MLFINSPPPRIDREECALLDSPNCLMMFCHSEWYRDLILANRGPNNKSEIVTWPYPIDPMPEGPLPAEYDLLIYAKNGHRPGLLEHLAELYPNHIQFHYGQYKRANHIEAARRSRACAYLADDDHGPLALQEILLAGCPVDGVRTGASFVQDKVIGFWVARLPPGERAIYSQQDAVLLAAYVCRMAHAMKISRHLVREYAVKEYSTDRITSSIVASLDNLRGSTIGKLARMSTEQATGNWDSLSAASDVYGQVAPLKQISTEQRSAKNIETEKVLYRTRRNSQIAQPKSRNKKI